ncbi:hypothetical protein Tco_0097500 [Tanacetum coccineum]
MVCGCNIKRIDYLKLNRLYDTFVPQTELSLEQRYCSYASTSNVTLETERLQKSSAPPKEMLKQSRMLNILANLDDEIKRLKKLVVTRGVYFAYNNDGDIKSIFHQEVQPISHTIRLWTNMLKEELTKEVQEMLNVFKSLESKVDETSKKYDFFLQNDLDRLLEATLVDDVRNLVMNSCVEIENKNLREEIARFSKESKDVSNGSKSVYKFCNDAVDVKEELSKRTAQFEKDFAKLEGQSISFELELQKRFKKTIL